MALNLRFAGPIGVLRSVGWCEQRAEYHDIDRAVVSTETPPERGLTTALIP